MSQEPTPFSMPQLDVVTEKPVTVNIDGKDYKIGRTKMSHLGALVARLRSERLNALMAMSGQIGGLIFANALGKCASVDPTEEDFWQYVSTERGSVYLLWRAMSDHMPGLTEEEVWKFVDKQPDLLTMLKTMSGLVDPKDLDAPLEEETTGPDPHPPVFGDQPLTGSESAPSSSSPSKDGDLLSSESSPGDSSTES